MLRQLFFGAAVCAASVAFASDTEDVQAAAKKLADGGNYSWKTTTEAAGGGFGGGAQEGKTEKDGFTTQTMHFGDNEIQIVVKGNKGALKTEDGWKTSEELANGDQQGPARFIGPMLANFKAPAAMAAEMASKLKDVKKDEGAYVVELTGDDAKPMMTFGRGRRGGGGGGGNGGQGPQISNAKVVMKIWVKDGVIEKYTSHITGTMSRGGDDIDIDRTTTTEFSDIGSTKVEVPDEVKKKLE